MGEAGIDTTEIIATSTNYTRRTRIWYIGAAIATGAAVLYTLAWWIPWVIVQGEVATRDQNGQPQFTTYTLRLTPGDTEGAFGSFIVGAFTILFLLLVPFLWTTQRWSTRQNAAWALVTSVLLSLAEFGGISFTNVVHLTDGLRPSILAVTSAQNLVGSVIAVAAFVVLSLSIALLLYLSVEADRRRRRERVPEPIAPAAQIHLPGVGAFTLGVVMLLASVFVVGWAADNCTASPLLVGSCTGLTFSGVEYYGIQAHTDLFDPIASLHAIPLFIVLGAGLILLALWAWRRITPGLCLWITLWLAAVTFFVVVAVAGIGVVTEHAADLGLQAGTWKGQTGAYLAGAGLVVAWLALISLWYAALRGGGAPVAAEQTAAGG